MNKNVLKRCIRENEDDPHGKGSNKISKRAERAESAFKYIQTTKLSNRNGINRSINHNGLGKANTHFSFPNTQKTCENGIVINDASESQTLISEKRCEICEEGNKSSQHLDLAKQFVSLRKADKITCMDVDESSMETSEILVIPKSYYKFLAPSILNSTNVLDGSNLSDCFDSQSLQTHLKLRNYLEVFEMNIGSFMDDNNYKKFRFSYQKAVTIPLNAISPVSSSHLSDKFYKLHNLLSGQTVMVGGANVCASEHPMGVAYCKNLLAKKFVRQGDLTVSSKPDAAFAIAAVLVSLWVDFPDFGQLVLAHFQVECPYLAPVFMPQVEGQSIEAYHKSLGYHYTDTGDVEKQDSFLKRMSGIMRLYAATIISKVRQNDKANPLGPAEGWRWMSAILNLSPRPDICATLIYDFLEVAGNTMFQTYGFQFKKMLFYICQEYFPKLEKVTPASAGGPLVRLEQFLQKVLKTESIPPPPGVLPPNFW